MSITAVLWGGPKNLTTIELEEPVPTIRFPDLNHVKVLPFSEAVNEVFAPKSIPHIIYKLREPDAIFPDRYHYDYVGQE